MKLAEAYVEIKGDYKNFRSELSKEGQSAGKSVASSFAQAFAGAAFAGGIAASIGAADRLEQAIGANKAVFGEAGKAAEEFAQTSAKSFGISEAAALNLTAQLGALLQGMGLTAEEAVLASEDMVALGADLAATFGGKPEEAVMALGAALRGERDPIEKYGISLNSAEIERKALELGLYSGVGALDSHGRAMATLKLFTDEAGGAVGAFGRESSTAAGQAAILRAEAEDSAASFGQVLLPIYTQVLQVTTWLVTAFGSLPAPVQTAVVALAGIVVFAGPIKTLVGSAKALEGALSKVGVSGKAAGIGFGLLTAALVVYELRQNAVKAKIEELAGLLDNQFKQAILDSAAAFDSYKPGIRDEIFSLGEAAGFTGEEILGMVAPTSELQARLLQLAESDTGFRTSLESTGITLELLRTTVGNNAAAQAQYEATMATTTTTTENLRGATEGGIGAIEHLAEKLATARERLDELAASTIASTNADINYEDQVWQTAFALEEYNTSMAEGNLTLEEARGLFEQTRDKLLDQAEAFVEAEGASLDSEAGARLYKEELGRLAGQLAPGSELRRFLDDYIGDLNRIPKNITTTVRVNQEGGVDINGDGRIDARALGGPVAGGVPVLVGEKGPEVFVPSVPGQIIPNNQLKTGGSSTWMNTGAMTILSNKLAQITDEVDALTAATAESADAQASFEDASDALANKLAETMSELDALAAATDEGAEVQASFKDATAATAVALEAYNNALNAGNNALNDRRGLLESARNALLDQANAFTKLEGASFDSEAGARLYREELGRLAASLAPGSALRVSLEEYIATLNRIPRLITTTVQVNQEDAAVDIGGGVGGQVGASGGGMSAEQFGREAARAMARELRVLMRVG